MSLELNPYVGLNFLPLNAKMATPPAYFLQRVYDYDDKLVLFPSYAVPFAYVIARRRQRTSGLTDKALEDTLSNPDTKAALAHNLVPVSMMYRTGESWNPDPVIASLQARDIWRHGGADKSADLMDGADARRHKQTKDAIRDDMWNRSGDAWRSYQARTGQRNAR
jgi:hypothetical protein